MADSPTLITHAFAQATGWRVQTPVRTSTACSHRLFAEQGLPTAVRTYSEVVVA